MHLLAIYLELGVIIAPLMHIYALWDNWHHPVVNPALRPTKLIHHVRMLIFFYLFWPILAPLTVFGLVMSVFTYMIYGVWPP